MKKSFRAAIGAVMFSTALTVAAPAATAAPAPPVIAGLNERAPSTSREQAPDTDACPNQLAPPEAITTSEIPVPGMALPAALPVAIAGNCGISAAEDLEVPEELLASAWLVGDIDTGEIIAAKDPHGRYRPASIIKVLLALLAVEKLDPATEVVVSKESAEQVGSAVGLGEGGRYSVDELLHGLLLASGNDAAHALAQELGGDDVVLQEINALAHDLGTTDTRATSYSGLDAPGMSTSAFDMGLIYRAAYAEPAFFRIVDTTHLPFPGYDGLPGYEVWNDNGLFLNDPDGIGGKTGFTDDANHTFVGAMDRDDRRLFAVILDTTTEKARPWNQAQLLLNAAYDIPEGEGVGLLEPVTSAGSELATPTPAAAPPAESNPVEEPGVHAAETTDPQDWIVPGILSIIAITVLAVIAITVSRRLNQGPARHGRH